MCMDKKKPVMISDHRNFTTFKIVMKHYLLQKEPDARRIKLGDEGKLHGSHTRKTVINSEPSFRTVH